VLNGVRGEFRKFWRSRKKGFRGGQLGRVVTIKWDRKVHKKEIHWRSKKKGVGRKKRFRGNDLQQRKGNLWNWGEEERKREWEYGGGRAERRVEFALVD